MPSDEIKNWLTEEVAAGIAPSSVTATYGMLRRGLQVAVEKQKRKAGEWLRREPKTAASEGRVTALTPAVDGAPTMVEVPPIGP